MATATLSYFKTARQTEPHFRDLYLQLLAPGGFSGWRLWVSPRHKLLAQLREAHFIAQLNRPEGLDNWVTVHSAKANQPQQQHPVQNVGVPPSGAYLSTGAAQQQHRAKAYQPQQQLPVQNVGVPTSGANVSTGAAQQPRQQQISIPFEARPVRRRPAVIKAIAKRKIVKAPLAVPAPVTPRGLVRDEASSEGSDIN